MTGGEPKELVVFVVGGGLAETGGGRVKNFAYGFLGPSTGSGFSEILTPEPAKIRLE